MSDVEKTPPGSLAAAPIPPEERVFWHSIGAGRLQPVIDFLDKYQGHYDLEKAHPPPRAKGEQRTPFTPLTFAASAGHCDIIELLLERGANINAKDGTDETPLSAACGFGCTNAVTLLLSRNAALEGLEEIVKKARRHNYLPIVELLEKEPARRQQAAQERRKEAMSVFTTGLPNGLRRPKLKLKLPQKQGPI